MSDTRQPRLRDEPQAYKMAILRMGAADAWAAAAELLASGTPPEEVERICRANAEELRK